MTHSREGIGSTAFRWAVWGPSVLRVSPVVTVYYSDAENAISNQRPAQARMLGNRCSLSNTATHVSQRGVGRGGGTGRCRGVGRGLEVGVAEGVGVGVGVIPGNANE